MTRIALLLLAASIAAHAQPARTTVTGTITDIAGSPVRGGVIEVELNAQCTAPGGYTISTARTSYTIATNGTVSFSLVPNDTCIPSSTSYKATYRIASGPTYIEYWSVPTSGSPVTLNGIRILGPTTPGAQVPYSQLQVCASNGQSLVTSGGLWTCVTPLVNPMTLLGDFVYGGASGAITRLAGNTTATRKFLSQTGTGTVSAAPVWEALQSSDLPAIPGLSGLTIAGTIPRVSSSGTLAHTKLVCTALDPAVCTLYDDTATTGISQFRVRAGAGQGGNPFFRFANNADTALSIIGADGGFTTYVGATIKTALTQNLLQLTNDSCIGWKPVNDLVSANPFDMRLCRYGTEKRLYIYDPDVGTDYFHFNGALLSMNFGLPTSAFPMWKRSGTNLQSRLGDDSGYAGIQGSALTAFSALTMPIKADGTPGNGELWMNSAGTTLRYRDATGVTRAIPYLDGTGRMAAGFIPFTVVDTVSDMTMASSSHIDQTAANWTPPIRTVAGGAFPALPSASSNARKVYLVVDCESTSACSTGGGANFMFLSSNGTSWVSLGGSGGGGGGEANTASNVGTGTGIFHAKVGVDLRFRALNAASNMLSVALNTDRVDINLIPGNVPFTSLGSWPATVDATEVGHLNGVTSALQTQLDAKELAANKNAAGGYPGLTSGKIAGSQMSEVLNLSDLLDVASKRGNSTSVQLAGAGTPANNDCAKFDANGNLVSAGQPCWDPATGRFTKAFATPANPWVVAASEHGLADDDFSFEAQLDGTNRWESLPTNCFVVRIAHSGYSVRDVVCEFTANKVGRIRIMRGGGSANGGGGTGDVTDVLAGTGIAVTNPGGPQPTVALNINGGSAQTCSVGNVVTAISAAGIVTCSPDATGSGLPAGGTIGQGLRNSGPGAGAWVDLGRGLEYLSDGNGNRWRVTNGVAPAPLFATTTWDPTSIAALSRASTTVTVAGAQQGDVCVLGIPPGVKTLGNLDVACTFETAGTATIWIDNNHNSAARDPNPTANWTVTAIKTTWSVE